MAPRQLGRAALACDDDGVQARQDGPVRLLEQEGLTYYFEHGRSEVVLAITDMPGVSPMSMSILYS